MILPRVFTQSGQDQTYADTLTKEEVAAKAGYEANGGGFNNTLGRLRTLELVRGRGNGTVTGARHLILLAPSSRATIGYAGYLSA